MTIGDRKIASPSEGFCNDVRGRRGDRISSLRLLAFACGNCYNYLRAEIIPYPRCLCNESTRGFLLEFFGRSSKNGRQLVGGSL